MLFFILAGIVALVFGRVFYFLAIEKMDVRLAVAISASYPLVTVMLSFFIFKETITLRMIVGIMMITLGGILVLI